MDKLAAVENAAGFSLYFIIHPTALNINSFAQYAGVKYFVVNI